MQKFCIQNIKNVKIYKEINLQFKIYFCNLYMKIFNIFHVYILILYDGIFFSYKLYLFLQISIKFYIIFIQKYTKV